MTSRLFTFGDGERRTVLVMLIRVLTGDLGDALVEGLGRRDRGAISHFVAKLKKDLEPFGREYEQVDAGDRSWVAESIESILRELAIGMAAPRSGSSKLLTAALRGPYAVATILRSTEAAVKSLSEPANNAQSYFELAIDTMSSVLCDWVSADDHAAQAAQTSATGELLRASDSMSLTLDDTLDAVRDVHARLSRTTADTVVRRYRSVIQGQTPTLLVDRDQELQLAHSLAPPGRNQIIAWLAPEKSGKSGLAYTISHGGIESAEIVPFFIRQRDATSNSLEAFLFITGAYLAMQVGERYGPPDGGGIDAIWGWRDLLESAAFECRARGKQLILVIDGLDEELAHHGDTAAPSIASVIPDIQELQAVGLKLIVTSRPNPPMPPDVPDLHWLRQAGSWTALSPSAVAASAVDPSEIDALMNTEIGRGIAGLLAVAGAPLTAGDMSEFLRLPVPVVRSLLSKGISRNLVRSRHPSGAIQYEIGHESTLVRIVQNLAPGYADAHDLRDRHDWRSIRDRTLRVFRRSVLKAAARASRHGWEGCSPYLLSEAFVRLAETEEGARQRLLSWLVDRNRHAAQRVKGMTWIDCAGQLAGAADRMTIHSMSDLFALQELLAMFFQIKPGGLAVPLGAVRGCAVAGDLDKAFAVAQRIETKAGSASGLISVAEAARAVGNDDLAQRAVTAAEEATEGISQFGTRQKTLVDVATNYRELGRPEDARRILSRLDPESGGGEPWPPTFPSVPSLGESFSVAAEHDAIFRALPSDARLAQLMGATQDALRLIRKAELTARGFDQRRRETALSDVADALLLVGANDAALEVYDELLLREGADLADRSRTLARALEYASHSGHVGGMPELVARYVPSLSREARYDAEVCLTLATACRIALAPELAENLVRQAAEILSSESDQHASPDSLVSQAITELVANGLFSIAQLLSERLSSRDARDKSQTSIAMAVGDPDDITLLEAKASQETNPFVAEAHWLEVAGRRAEAGEQSRSISAIGRAWAVRGDYTSGWDILERVTPGSTRQLALRVPLI